MEAESDRFAVGYCCIYILIKTLHILKMLSVVPIFTRGHHSWLLTHIVFTFLQPQGDLSPPKIKPGIFYLLDGCVDHYTMQPLKIDHLYKVKTEHIPVSLLLQFKFSIVHTCPGD